MTRIRAQSGAGGPERRAHGAATVGVLGLEAYRALYDHNPDGVLFTAPDGRVLAANPAACRILGRREGEICALGRLGLVDPDDERWDVLVKTRDRLGQVHGVARMLRGDGAAIEVEISTQVFHAASDQIRTCTIIRDVTDRIAIERELRDSRQQLAEAEQLARMGSWTWLIATDRVTWSDGMFEIYGMTPNEFDATLGGGQQRVYPDDRQRVSDELARAVRERSGFALEYRAVRADGRVRTVRNRAEVVVDEHGEPVRMVGIAQDITDAKLAQEALRTTSSDLERRAVELQRLARVAGPQSPTSPSPDLTQRQLEILRLVAAGMTSAQIATRLYVSEATVKWHVKQILARTGASNRAEAVALVLGRPG